MKSVKKQVIEEKFAELYLEHVSDFDIERLYNQIMKTNKLKEMYGCNTHNMGCC